MPTTLIEGDTLQVTIWNQLGDQAVLNILYFQVTATVGVPTLEGIANDLDDGIAAAILPTMSSSGSHLGLVLRRITPFPSAMVLTESGFAAGGVASEPLANQAAAIATKRTATPGPVGRGRIYFGLLPKTFSTDGLHLTTAGKAAIQTAANLLNTPFGVGPAGDSCTLTHVLYHGTAPITTRTVTSVLARSKLATQRRRGGTGRQNAPPF